jgi:hypothetical protein
VVEVDGTSTMPSAVFAAEDGQLIVGREAERVPGAIAPPPMVAYPGNAMPAGGQFPTPPAPAPGSHPPAGHPLPWRPTVGSRPDPLGFFCYGYAILVAAHGIFWTVLSAANGLNGSWVRGTIIGMMVGAVLLAFVPLSVRAMREGKHPPAAR